MSEFNSREIRKDKTFQISKFKVLFTQKSFPLISFSERVKKQLSQ